MHADSTAHAGPRNPDPEYYRINDDGEKVEVSRSEVKAYRRKNVTVRHHRLPLCGHALVPGREPRHRNCESCWFAFFQTHGELTQAVDKLFSEFGEHGLRQLRGPAFTTNYLKFMSTVAQWKEQLESKENNAQQSTSGSGGSDSADIGTDADGNPLEEGQTSDADGCPNFDQHYEGSDYE